MPMPCRRATIGVGSWTASPRTRISPASGRTAPARAFMRVDLPAPFSPTIAWIEPGRTARLMPSRATMPPYCLRSPTTSTTGDTAGDGRGPSPVGVAARWSAVTTRPCSVRGLLGLVLDGFDVGAPARDLAVDQGLVVLAGLLGGRGQLLELRE